MINKECPKCLQEMSKIEEDGIWYYLCECGYQEEYEFDPDIDNGEDQEGGI